MISIAKFMKDERGLSTIEYIIGAGIMAGLALLVFLGLKGSIGETSEDVGDALERAGDEAVNAGGN